MVGTHEEVIVLWSSTLFLNTSSVEAYILHLEHERIWCERQSVADPELRALSPIGVSYPRRHSRSSVKVAEPALCALLAQEHEAHRSCPAEDAAEEHREKLLKKMCSLWDESCENTYVHLKREAISAEYGKMPPFLHEEEQHHLDRLQREGKEGFQSEAVKEHVHQAVNPELCAGPSLDSLKASPAAEAPITLEYESRANRHVFLYADLRRLSVGGNPQTVPRIALAWGTQIFPSGGFYWEMQVEDSWYWAFGVCNDYLKESGNVQIDKEKGLFLLGCDKNSLHYNVFTPSILFCCPMCQSLLAQREYSCEDREYCEDRTVSFVDVAQSSLICSISSCSFSPDLRPIFCCSHF
ncbi:tripartite motif-containing protein 51-like [Glossophaga mutica]